MWANRTLHQSRRARRALRSPYRAAPYRRNYLAPLPSRALATRGMSDQASSASESSVSLSGRTAPLLGWALVPLIGFMAGVGVSGFEGRFISLGKISLLNPNSGTGQSWL